MHGKTAASIFFFGQQISLILKIIHVELVNFDAFELRDHHAHVSLLVYLIHILGFLRIRYFRRINPIQVYVYIGLFSYFYHSEWPQRVLRFLHFFFCFGIFQVYWGTWILFMYQFVFPILRRILKISVFILIRKELALCHIWAPLSLWRPARVLSIFAPFPLWWGFVTFFVAHIWTNMRPWWNDVNPFPLQPKLRHLIGIWILTHLLSIPRFRNVFIRVDVWGRLLYRLLRGLSGYPIVERFVFGRVASFHLFARRPWKVVL